MEFLENVGNIIFYVAIVVSFAVTTLRFVQYFKHRKDNDEPGE